MTAEFDSIIKPLFSSYLVSKFLMINVSEGGFQCLWNSGVRMGVCLCRDCGNLMLYALLLAS